MATNHSTSTSTPEAAPRAAIGVFGGTFDPPHLAHLRLAEEAREALGLTTVRWIPAGQPPHRSTPRSGAEHRLAMVRAAVSGHAAFEVDDAEVRSAAPSYTVPTLERLRAEIGPQRPLVLILGADAFAGLPTWHRWEALFSLAHLGIATRPGHSLLGAGLEGALAGTLQQRRTERPQDLHDAPAGRILCFNMTPLDISASAIRALLQRGASARYLLPDRVLEYIRTHGLYRDH